MKIGDKVRITTNETNEMPIHLDYRGSEGIIVSNGKDKQCYKQQQYWVRLKDVIGDRWFCENELEVIK